MVCGGILCALSLLVQAHEGRRGASGVDAASFQGAAVAPVPGQSLAIRVLPGEWGDATREDIETLLAAAARELWVYFPERRLKPILVAPSEEHPRVRFASDLDGEYLVHLSARDRHWSQYAYQFAHEFAHILSNYERNPHVAVRRNQWFDESLCETASLFTLRRLGAAWLTKEGAVPFAHWKSYGHALQSYALELLMQPHRALPARLGFADWYRENAVDLGKSPYLRERDELVAGMLLPLFEKSPGAWGAIGYLNLEESDASGSFAQYLSNWHRNSPSAQRPVVEEIIALFGLEAPGRLASRGATPDVPQSR